MEVEGEARGAPISTLIISADLFSMMAISLSSRSVPPTLSMPPIDDDPFEEAPSTTTVGKAGRPLLGAEDFVCRI